MARYNNTNLSVGSGSVPTRPISRIDLQAFSTALDKIDTKSREALEKKGAIEAALAQLEMNPQEDKFKQQYIQSIKDQINSYAQFGDYSQALDAATELAGSALSNPMILGRVRAQAAYKQFTDTINKRQDISQDTKNWALAQNPYNYKDTFDEHGNVIGGNEWTSAINPVSTPDLNKILMEVKQAVVTHHGSSDGAVKFVDANGQLTDDVSQGVFGLAYQKGSEWTYVDEKEVREILDSVIKSTPDAAAGLQQDYDVALWKYNNMTDKQKAENVDSFITTDGKLLNPTEYLEKRIKGFVKGISYRDVSTTTKYGDGMSNWYAFQAKAAANDAKGSGNGLGNGGDLSSFVSSKSTPLGKPIMDSITNVVGDKYAELNNTMADLAKVFPKAIHRQDVQKAFSDGDYNTVSKILKGCIQKGNPNVNRALHLLTDLEDAGNTFNSYLDGKGEDYRQAFTFYSAIKAHAPLPANNTYTRQYEERLNKAFNGNKTAYLGYVCSDNEQYEQIGRAIGITKPSDINSWAAKGFQIVRYNGHNVIKFDRNNRYISDVADAINSSRMGIGHSWGALVGTSGFLRYGTNGQVQNRRMYGDSIQNGIASFFGKTNPDIDYSLEDVSGFDIGPIHIRGDAHNITNLADKNVEGIDWFRSKTPVQSAGYKFQKLIQAVGDDMNTTIVPKVYPGLLSQAANNDNLNRGVISRADWKANDEDIIAKDVAVLAGADLNQYAVYSDNGKDPVISRVTDSDDVNDLQEYLRNAYQNDPKRVKMYSGSKRGKSGVYIEILPSVDNKNKSYGYKHADSNATVQIFIPGFESSALQQQVDSSYAYKAIGELEDASVFSKWQHTCDDGTKLSNVTNNGAILTKGKNSVVVDLNTAQTYLAQDFERRALRNEYAITNDKKALGVEIANMLAKYGINQDSPVFKDEFVKQFNLVVNGL